MLVWSFATSLQLGLSR